MGLFDIMDEISEKQITKTETGDNRIMGVVVGIVAKNYSKDLPGRVCVTVPTRDKDANELKWARVAVLSAGDKWGHYFLPEVGDQVLLVFENGNIEKPYVIGCIPKDSSQFISGAADEKNQFKKIMTRHGTKIEFMDNKEGEGEKDKFSIVTAKDMHSLVIDNEKKTVTISDKEAKNTVTMNTGEGTIEVKADKKFTLKVGTNITLTCDGSSGEVSIKAQKLTAEGTTGIEMKTNSAMKLSATNIEENATAGMKLSSSATMKIEGTMINIG